MTEFLIRRFVKNSDRIHCSRVRGRYIMLACVTGILLNLLLFGVKLLLGYLTVSVAVTADAFNNLSDIGSSAVTLIGFKIASKPADKEHPFGHGRTEYISAFVIACIIGLMGVDLFRSSVDRIRNPVPIRLGFVTAGLLVATVLVKLWLGFFSRKIGHIIGSTALAATASDNFMDVLSTSLVLAATALSGFAGLPLDGWVGAAVSVFIVFSALRTAKETVNPLLGEAPQKELLRRLEQMIAEREGILGVHDVMIHAYGPGKIFASLHAEVPADADLVEVHDLIDRCERDARKILGLELVIHTDPVDLNDDVVALKQEVSELLRALHSDLALHDFRKTSAEGETTLFFDVEVPDDLNDSDEALTQTLRDRIGEIRPGYRCVIRIDRHYRNGRN